MDPYENLASSSGKAYSPTTRNDLHAKAAATHLLHLSYRELFRESEKAEPRLSRLLGHISLYENVARWQTEVVRGLLPFVKLKPEEASGTSLASSNALELGQKANRIRSTATLSTLTEFQAFVREQMESKNIVTLTTEEVCSDSDSEEEWGSDNTYSNESEDYSDSSDDERNLIYWMAHQPTKSSSPHTIEDKLTSNDKITTSNMELMQAVEPTNIELTKANDRDTHSQDVQAQP